MIPGGRSHNCTAYTGRLQARFPHNFIFVHRAADAAVKPPRTVFSYDPGRVTSTHAQIARQADRSMSVGVRIRWVYPASSHCTLSSRLSTATEASIFMGCSMVVRLMRGRLL